MPGSAAAPPPMKRLLHALACVLLLAYLHPPAHAYLAVSDPAVFVDAAGTQTIADIAALPAAAFTPLPDDLLSKGYTRAVHWLRFRLDVPAGAAGPWWLEVHPAYLDDLRLYEPVPDAPGGYAERRAGDRLPFAQREIPYRGFLFKLDPAPQRDAPLYLRIETSSTSLALLKLWQAERFAAAVQGEYVLLGGVFGLLAIILVINLIHWLNEREPLVLRYLLYLSMAMLNSFIVQGFAAQFVLGDRPLLVNHVQNVTSLLVVAAAGYLYRAILLVERDTPLLWWAYRILTLLPLALLPALAFGYAMEALRVAISWGAVMTLVGTARSLQLIARGVSGSLLLLLAILFSIFGVMLSVAQVLGIISGNFVIAHAFLIGLTGNIVALHLAIAMRMRRHKQEQQAMLAQVKEIEFRAGEERKAREEQAHFISMLAHEIRTPVAGIAAATDAIEIILADRPPEIRTRLERIRRALQRITGVAERYLQMDRADNARLDPQLAVHDVRDIIAAAVGQCTGERQRLRVRADAALHVLADADLLATAVLNLIDNAMKYSPADSPVELVVRGDGAHGVAIEVADRGAGIPPALRDAVFERYVRAPEHGNVPGVGLGLALVRKIAAIHSGGVAALAREGGGTVFRLTLPTVAPPEINVRS